MKKVDAEYLKGLRTATAVTDADLEGLLAKGEKLLIAVNKAEAKIADKKDRTEKGRSGNQKTHDRAVW